MTRETVILATLVVYLVLMMAIGLWAQRRTRDGGDFLLAGRRLGPWVASLSASASSSSAWTLLGVSGFAFDRGLSAIWLFPACVGGFMLNWYVLAPALRTHSHRSGALTMTEVLASGAPEPLRLIIVRAASVIILLALITYVASQFQAAGKTLAETFGLDPWVAVLVGAAIVVFYTLAGGFWAVSLTDSLQGSMMALTAALLPVGALVAVGPANVVSGMRNLDVPGYADLLNGLPLAAGIGFAMGLLGIGLGYPGQPHVVNRFMALREGERAIRIARAAAIGWAAVVYAGMILLGWTARIGFTGIGDGESAMVHVAAEVFPPLVAGVMIAAVLSAVMSTADSQLLVAASTVSHDLGGVGAGKLLVRSRQVVALLSLLAVAAALGVDETIFNRVLFAWSAMGCAFGPLLLVRVLRGSIAPAATLTAMLSGFALSVGAYLVKGSGVFGSWSGFYERVLPFLVAGAIALAGSRRR